MPLTIFSFGYFGWGNATERLVHGVDAVEKARGFAPPVFVDTRIRRSVRAVGFTGAAFERLVGGSRHRWMPALGNQFVVSHAGPKFQIAQPDAAEELLDLALASGQAGRRVIFFCGCQWPRMNGEIECHRVCVAELLRSAARRRQVGVHLQEWPGGMPRAVEGVTLPGGRIGRRTWGVTGDLATLASIPWGSPLYRDGSAFLTGPARWQHDGWHLPLLQEVAGDQAETAAVDLRRQLGLD